ncbi:hypothetical protein BO71DRAFT_468227 [Aspergillus ellipticus CBS 707.79]|uniref:Uncharacterized protein n=1 Tax=Aspergillus ellipticus CBS 707.79 TaxID=1448320 RepID=A0A319DIE4_9EURO|nr:hypothetical protein BO71DRAFT_468227 [Aspergillus ellipticus CBS 707.79]
MPAALFGMVSIRHATYSVLEGTLVTFSDRGRLVPVRAQIFTNPHDQVFAVRSWIPMGLALSCRGRIVFEAADAVMKLDRNPNSESYTVSLAIIPEELYEPQSSIWYRIDYQSVSSKWTWHSTLVYGNTSLWNLMHEVDANARSLS